MDLIVVVDNGTSFTIEVGYFDTIQEIKEKVHKYHGILVQHQTLKFHGKTLPDDLNIFTSDIIDGSHLNLIIFDPQQPPPPTTTIEETSLPSSSSSAHKIKILHRAMDLVMEMDMHDHVLMLKQNINEIEGIPLDRMVVYANGIELQDNHKSLHEYQIVDDTEVEVTVKPPTPPPTTTVKGKRPLIPRPTTTVKGKRPLIPPPTTGKPPIRPRTTGKPPLPPRTTTATAPVLTGSSSRAGGLLARKVKINVMSRSGEKISLEVNPLSNVSELRKELESRVNEGVGFSLPEEGYFFIHKQEVMEEDENFGWHGVAQGDTIDVFNGWVTRGP